MKKGVELVVDTKINVEKLSYADKSPRLGGVPKEISVKELEDKVGKGFCYSNNLFVEKEISTEWKDDETTRTATQSWQYYENFKKMGFTDLSAFTVCNMGTLGHGLFSARNFEAGECFILYAGVVNSPSRLEDHNHLYSFSFEAENPYTVSAKDIGNIARFIQHMPHNREEFIQAESVLTQVPIQQIRQQTAKDKKYEPHFWQYNNLVYKNGLTPQKVAWSNMSAINIMIAEVPCIIFFNHRKIIAGEQLGISYNMGYWVDIIKPELFDLKGSLIPHTHYGYKEILVRTVSIAFLQKLLKNKFDGKIKTFNYDESHYKQDLSRKSDLMQAVWFAPDAHPISIFKLRAKLCEYGVIGKEHDAIKGNAFVSELRRGLPSSFKVVMLERNPYARNGTDIIYDIICTTENPMHWSYFTGILKNPLYRNLINNKCLKDTREIILLDVKKLDSPRKQYLLQQLHETDFSETQQDQSTNDDDQMPFANSDESKNQILRHCPRLTIADLESMRDEFEKLFGNHTTSQAATTSHSSSATFSSTTCAINTETADLSNEKIKAILKKYQLAKESTLPSPEVALRRAAAKGDLTNVKFLVGQNADIDKPDTNPENQRTALHWAVINKCVPVAKYLLESGARADLYDAKGKTPNTYMMESNLEELVVLAKPSIKFDH